MEDYERIIDWELWECKDGSALVPFDYKYKELVCGKGAKLVKVFHNVNMEQATKLMDKYYGWDKKEKK